MKTVRLRTLGDAMGTTIDVEVHFSSNGNLLGRLIQVAAILRDDIARAKNETDLPLAAAKMVTRIETNFAAGHVVVSACVPEGMTSEQLQRALLELVPPESES